MRQWFNNIDYVRLARNAWRRAEGPLGDFLGRNGRLKDTWDAQKSREEEAVI